MPLDPTKLLSEALMLRLARRGSPEEKLALLDNPILSLDARRLLVFESEPEVQEEAVRRCIHANWLQELAAHGPASALRGLIDNSTYFPRDESAHPMPRTPWKYPRSERPWDRYSPDRSTFRHLLFLTGAVQVEEDPLAELERLRALDLEADEALREQGEAALAAFYTDLVHRVARNPALTEAGEDFLESFFTWWFRLPGDHVGEAMHLLDRDEPEIAHGMAASWATPTPVLERLLEEAYRRDDVALRRALTRWAWGNLPEQAQARLWADPDVRVRAWVLNYGLAPAEVMLRLARDPEIRIEHLPQAPYGSLSYEASKDYGEEFARVVRERFGLEVGWYVH